MLASGIQCLTQSWEWHFVVLVRVSAGECGFGTLPFLHEFGAMSNPGRRKFGEGFAECVLHPLVELLVDIG